MFWNLDGALPFWEQDAVIQIGTTWHEQNTTRNDCKTQILSRKHMLSNLRGSSEKNLVSQLGSENRVLQTLGTVEKVLFEKGSVILLMFTWLPRTATFCHLGCICSQLAGTAYTWWRKQGRRNSVFLWCSLFPPWNMNLLTETHLETSLASNYQVLICKQGNLFDLYELGIIFQRYWNAILNCHPSALINKWAAQKWF